jgi:hypothetical protein
MAYLNKARELMGYADEKNEKTEVAKRRRKTVRP